MASPGLAGIRDEESGPRRAAAMMAIGAKETQPQKAQSVASPRRGARAFSISGRTPMIKSYNPGLKLATTAAADDNKSLRDGIRRFDIIPSMAIAVCCCHINLSFHVRFIFQ